MKMIKLLVAVLLSVALFTGMCIAETEQADVECQPGTYAFGCFGYDISLATGLSEEGVHNARNATYGVTAKRLETCVTDDATAASAAKELFGSEVEISLGSDGVYRAVAADYYAFYRIYIKDETALMFRCTNQNQLYLLDRHVYLLDEPIWNEEGDRPVQMDSLRIPQYLPFGSENTSTGHDLSTWKLAMEAMLSRGEYGIYWDYPQYADETHDAVTGFLTALNRTVTIVYERENEQVESVQWFSFLPLTSEVVDLYDSTLAACETGAAIITAMFYADMELDNAKMAENVSTLQNSFTNMQVWIDSVSNEVLRMPLLLEDSTVLFGRELSLIVSTDIGSGYRVEGCIRLAD